MRVTSLAIRAFINLVVVPACWPFLDEFNWGEGSLWSWCRWSGFAYGRMIMKSGMRRDRSVEYYHVFSSLCNATLPPPSPWPLLFLQDGRTALHIACSLLNSEVVNLLLEKGADVAARDKVNALTLTKSLAAPRPPARGSASTASCIYSRIYSFEHIIILMHNAPRTLHNAHINFAYKLEHKWR